MATTRWDLNHSSSSSKKLSSQMVPRISLLPTSGKDLAELDSLAAGTRLLYAERAAVKQLPICSY